MTKARLTRDYIWRGRNRVITYLTMLLHVVDRFAASHALRPSAAYLRVVRCAPACRAQRIHKTWCWPIRSRTTRSPHPLSSTSENNVKETNKKTDKKNKVKEKERGGRVPEGSGKQEFSQSNLRNSLINTAI